MRELYLRVVFNLTLQKIPKVQNINPVWYGGVHSVSTDTDDLLDKDTPSHADGPGGAAVSSHVSGVT